MRTINADRIIVGCILAAMLAAASATFGQERKIDASKPTNLYSVFRNNFEYNDGPTANTYGYRGNLTYVPNPNHLIMLELPLLYNDETKKFGLSDIRFRYFWVTYRDYTKFFGAFAPSVDVFAPTGDIKDGLGSDRWVIAPGLAAGLMLHPRIQTFPIISYQYASAPETSRDLFPDHLVNERHGLTFQALTPIKLADTTTLQLTPWYIINDLNDVSQDDWRLQADPQRCKKRRCNLMVYA